MDKCIPQLRELVPEASTIMEFLSREGKLQEKSNGSVTVAQSLLKILTEPRYDGLHKLDVFFYVLERINNPYSTTQLINVPFKNGRKKTQTCFSASITSSLCDRHSGEFARIVEQLTGLDLCFNITRTYDDLRLFEAKIRFVCGRFPFQIVGPLTLTITIRPDSAAIGRALIEHGNRLYTDYDFGQRMKKNTRHAVDVLLQSALTNYAMRGEYDSDYDINRVDGTAGVPFGSFGYVSLLQDVLDPGLVCVRGPAATDDDWPGQGRVITSPLDSPDIP